MKEDAPKGRIAMPAVAAAALYCRTCPPKRHGPATREPDPKVPPPAPMSEHERLRATPAAH